MQLALTGFLFALYCISSNTFQYPVSYTHLDVYKRQVNEFRLELSAGNGGADDGDG